MIGNPLITPTSHNSEKWNSRCKQFDINQNLKSRIKMALLPTHISMSLRSILRSSNEAQR
jgi:hypothetical protein